jgi:hypothetical protein
MQKLLLLLFLVLASAGFLPAREQADLQASAYHDSIAQQRVQTQAEVVRQKLLQLLDDIQQNQMPVGDFAVAQKAAASLATLNESQVAPLVAMLKQAGNQPQASEIEAQLVAASQSQKDVQLNLKTLADSLEYQKDLSDLEERFEQLALRQTTNLRQTKVLAGVGANISPQLSLVIEIAHGEEANLAQEIGLAVEALQKVSHAAPEGQQAAFSDALDEALRLNIGPSASDAAEQIKARTFSVAASTQGQVLEGLQSVLLKMKMSEPMQDRLQAMGEKLLEIAGEQKSLAGKTAKSDPSAQSDLHASQGQISDHLSVLQRELAGLNAEAFQQTTQAMNAMQTADTALSDKPLDAAGKESVAQTQNYAASQLQAAGEALQAQLKSFAQNPAPPTPLEDTQALTQLDQQVQQAMAAEKALAANPAGPDSAQQQKQQAEHIGDLQREALPLSQPAAQALGEASAQMQQDAPADAAGSLAKADAALQQQISALAKAAALQQNLEALSSQIAAAQQQTTQAGQTLDQGQPDLSAAVKQTQLAQQTLGQAQTQAGADVPPELKKDLVAAQADLTQSGNAAAQLKKGDASTANADAQKQLGDAMKAVGTALAKRSEPKRPWTGAGAR